MDRKFPIRLQHIARQGCILGRGVPAAGSLPGLFVRAAWGAQVCCISARLSYPERNERLPQGAEMTRTLIATLVAATMSAGVASAQDFTPAIIFDMGGKFDKSFNEAAYRGAETFKDETGIEYLEFEVTNESQRDQAL